MHVQVEAQSQRVKDYMNYMITDQMEDYDPDMDQILILFTTRQDQAFKKIYYDADFSKTRRKIYSKQKI